MVQNTDQLKDPKHQHHCSYCLSVGRLFLRFAVSGHWGSGESQECLENASATPESFVVVSRSGDISKITSDRDGSALICKEFP